MDSVLMQNRVLNLDESSWVLTKLGDLAKDISKRVDNPGESEYDRFVGLGNFVSGEIKIKTWETTENLASSAKAFKGGDILFARRNAYLRRASLVDFDGCCSGDAFVLRENHGKVVPGFLAFLFNSNALWDYANSNAAGTMSKRVKWRDLAEYEFLLPPKEQQAQLAKLLWAMDEVIERELLLSNKLKTFYNVGIEELLEGKSLLKKENGKYSILKDNSVRDKWENVSIGELCNKVTDGEHLSPVFLEEGKPILSAKDIRENDVQIENSKFISEEAFITSRKRCDPDFNDVLIVSRGATIGRTTVNKLKQPFALMGSVILLKPNDKILGDYLGMLIRRNRYQRRLLAISGSTAQQAIYLVDIKKSKVDIPNVEYQNLIVEFMTDISNRLMQAKEKISTSKSLQKSLINQIF